MSFFRRRTSAASSHRDAKPGGGGGGGGGATAGDSDSDEDVVLIVDDRTSIDGVMFKLGDKGLGRKLWRKRYFKTDKGRLYYYKPNERNKPLGLVSLDKVKAIQQVSVQVSIVPMGGRADAIIGLITESRTYYIMTDGQKTMNKWINTLIAIKGYWAVNNLASMADDASIMDEDEGGDEDDSAAPELSSDSAVEVAVDADALSQALRDEELEAPGAITPPEQEAQEEAKHENGKLHADESDDDVKGKDNDDDDKDHKEAPALTSLDEHGPPPLSPAHSSSSKRSSQTIDSLPAVVAAPVVNVTVFWDLDAPFASSPDDNPRLRLFRQSRAFPSIQVPAGSSVHVVFKSILENFSANFGDLALVEPALAVHDLERRYNVFAIGKNGYVARTQALDGGDEIANYFCLERAKTPYVVSLTDSGHEVILATIDATVHDILSDRALKARLYRMSTVRVSGQVLMFIGSSTEPLTGAEQLKSLTFNNGECMTLRYSTKPADVPKPATIETKIDEPAPQPSAIIRPAAQPLTSRSISFGQWTEQESDDVPAESTTATDAPPAAETVSPTTATDEQTSSKSAFARKSSSDALKKTIDNTLTNPNSAKILYVKSPAVLRVVLMKASSSGNAVGRIALSKTVLHLSQEGLWEISEPPQAIADLPLEKDLEIDSAEEGIERLELNADQLVTLFVPSSKTWHLCRPNPPEPKPVPVPPPPPAAESTVSSPGPTHDQHPDHVIEQQEQPQQQSPADLAFANQLAQGEIHLMHLHRAVALVIKEVHLREDKSDSDESTEAKLAQRCDDTQSENIGMIVRRELCTALAQCILYGIILDRGEHAGGQQQQNPDLVAIKNAANVVANVVVASVKSSLTSFMSPSTPMMGFSSPTLSASSPAHHHQQPQQPHILKYSSSLWDFVKSATLASSAVNDSIGEQAEQDQLASWIKLITKLDNDRNLFGDDNRKFRCFVCTLLNNHSLVTWTKVVLQHPQLLGFHFVDWAFVRQPTLRQGLIESLQLVVDLPWHLSIYYELGLQQSAQTQIEQGATNGLLESASSEVAATATSFGSEKEGKALASLAAIASGKPTQETSIVPLTAIDKLKAMSQSVESSVMNDMSVQKLTSSASALLARTVSAPVAADPQLALMIVERRIVPLQRSAGTPLGLKLSYEPRSFRLVDGKEIHNGNVIVIKSLVPNSPAAQQGRINPGDILEGIDDTLVLGYLPDQAAQLLKAEQLKLIFLTPTARLGIDTSSSPAAAPESDAASTPQTPSISRLRQQLGAAAKRTVSLASVPSTPTSSGSSGALAADPENWVLQDYELTKMSEGFGLDLASRPAGGLLIMSIHRGGAAWHANCFQVGDMIVRINGVSLLGNTHAESIELLKRTVTVRLSVLPKSSQ